MFKHRFLAVSRHRSGGFTLVELMVTLVVLAIALGIGVPGFRDFIEGQKVKTAAFDLSSALMVSRSEAIKRNADVTLAPKTGGWTAGWTVKSGTTTLLEQAAIPGINFDDSSPTSLVFHSTGRRPTITGGPDFEISAGTRYYRCIKFKLDGTFSTTPKECEP
jgi:type IV fimbrial biogenesis protein FimT